MLETIVLDGLLILILLLLVPIGVYRGGIREGFTSAGVLLGVALSAEWAVRWGDWIAANSRLAQGSARFLVAIGLLALTTIGVGYGASAAFAYRPGPGGRLYGGLLAATNGVVFLSYVFDYVITFLFNGDRPPLIMDSYVARAIAAGTGTILLLCVALIVLATAFGLFVRERSDDEMMGVDSRKGIGSRARRSKESRTHAGGGHRVDKVEPAFVPTYQQGRSAGSLAEPTMPVQIREVRHWEGEPMAPGNEPSRSGWSQTWPTDSVQSNAQPPRSPPSEVQPAGQARLRASTRRSDQPSPTPGSEVLQDWLRRGQSPPDRSRSPETTQDHPNDGRRRSRSD